MATPAEKQIVELASKLQANDPHLEQQAAIQLAIKQLFGIETAAPQRAQRPAKSKPPARAPNRGKGGTQDLEKKLRSIGIVLDGKATRPVIEKALAIIEKQLKNPHVGLARRQYLMSLRTQNKQRVTPPARVVSGGLPSLGKRR